MSPGVHSRAPAPRQRWKPEQRRTARKSPRYSEETLARIARNARVLDERVKELRDALVTLARAGKRVKVLPEIVARGWPNEALLCARFGEIYGSTPKAYASAFKACSACGRLELADGCAGCVVRAAIQGGAGR